MPNTSQNSQKCPTCEKSVEQLTPGLAGPLQTVFIRSAKVSSNKFNPSFLQIRIPVKECPTRLQKCEEMKT